VASNEHLALLRQGTAIWNEWRGRNPKTKPDLSRADLTGANLNRADLSRADLSGVDVSQANLSRADLSEADLSGAISYASDSPADLSGANLSRADLEKAKLGHVKLTGANLTGAFLIWTDLSGADLSAANLSRADLTETDMGQVNLTGANLTGARLHRTYLHAADLTGARLCGADLGKTDFVRAVLSETDFSNARLSHVIFAYSDLTKAIGLDTCKHDGPSIIEPSMLSHNLSISFLRGCGLPEHVIEYLPSLTGIAIGFYTCFISYSAKDQTFADRLHADLQNKGVRCWFAPHDLPTGAKIWDAIDEAIHLRDKLLVILSKASIGSDWVEDEVNKAYAEERSRKEIVLFPIRIDNVMMSTTEPWAVKLRDQRNIGDFRQWKKPEAYQKVLGRLLRDLKPPTTS
jgi:uncharacterized protein YjbI with pentapeptide repeats